MSCICHYSFVGIYHLTVSSSDRPKTETISLMKVTKPTTHVLRRTTFEP